MGQVKSTVEDLKQSSVSYHLSSVTYYRHKTLKIKTVVYTEKCRKIYWNWILAKVIVTWSKVKLGYFFHLLHWYLSLLLFNRQSIYVWFLITDVTKWTDPQTEKKAMW